LRYDSIKYNHLLDYLHIRHWIMNQ